MTRLPMNRRDVLRTSGAAVLGTGAVAASAASTANTVETVEIDPAGEVSVEPDQAVDFSAQALDENGNPVEEDDAAFDWEATGGSINDSGLFVPSGAGEYEVTAAFQGVESEPTTVTAGGPVETVELAPDQNLSIVPGQAVEFSAEAFDVDGNLFEDDDTEFDWDAGSAAIAGDGTFEPTQTGQFDVTATYDGVESDPTTVFVLEVETVEIEPATDQNVLAGESLDFSAEALDGNGNLVENVDEAFDWDAGGGNISTDGVFQETEPGEYSVTATLQGVTSEPTGVTVEPGDVDSVVLDPASDQELGAGNTLEFSAEALNASGAVLEDESAAFDWDAEGGEITNDGIFEETAAGEYNVTATLDGVVSEPTTVEVVTGSVQSVVLDPSGGQDVGPGEVIEFSAEALDGDGFLVEDDDEAFIWDAGDGTIDGDGTFEESAEGTYDVTATLDGTTSAPTTVFVNEDEVAEVLIEPENDQVIEAGETVDFSAEAVDGLGNILEDSDEEFNWSAEGGGGSIQSDGTFDDVATVDHEVTAAFAGVVSDPVTVTVESPLPPLPGAADPPNDLDGDGLYEDVDGNGEFDIFDVQALFNNLDSDAVQNNPDAYDFSGDGSDEVGIIDVQFLFDRLKHQ
jgi:hypothetical protein